MEVHGRVARVVGRRPIFRLLALRPEALQARPRLDERAVHREVLVAHEAGAASRLHDLGEELRRHFMFEQSLPVPREGRVVEALLDAIHVEEPAEQQVVVELLAEEPLAAHAVERHQQRRLQEPLGRDRGPADFAVHRVERRRERRQRLVGERLHPPQWVVLRHPLVGGDEAEHRDLALVAAAHARTRSRPPGPVDLPKQLPDRFLDRLGLEQHIPVRVANHANALLLQPGIARHVPVPLRPLVVLTPVQLDREARGWAVEVEGVRANGVLAPELRPHPVPPQPTPEFMLRVGRPLPKESPELKGREACHAPTLFVRYDSPLSPSLSPGYRRGRGRSPMARGFVNSLLIWLDPSTGRLRSRGRPVRFWTRTAKATDEAVLIATADKHYIRRLVTA